MSWLAKTAEALLESADKRASVQILSVKERAGILSTPAESEDESTPVVLSRAAAALLDAEERAQLLASGTATIEADGSNSELAPMTPAANSSEDGKPEGGLEEAALHRRHRVAEWSALQQELQILSMHGRKVQARLHACAAQLREARAAEAEAKRQLGDSLNARSAAEQAASQAQSSVGEQRSASDAKVAASEARALAAERTASECEAQVTSLIEDLALSRQDVQRAEEAATLQSATMAGLRLELAAEREQAEQAQTQASSRIAAAEALNEELQQKNLELSAAIGTGARMSDQRGAQAAEAAAAAQRLEGELAKTREERDVAISAERRASDRLHAADAESRALRTKYDEALTRAAKAEHALAAAQQEARQEQTKRAADATSASAAASAQAAQRALGGATGGAADSEAAARAANATAALVERESRIEQLMSERAALRLQLEGEVGRRTALERKLSSIEAGGGGGGGGGHGHRIDMPLLGVEHAAGGLRRDASGQQAPSRYFTRLLSANVRRPRPQLVQAAAAADDFAAAVDRLTLTAGRHLRMHRPLRLGAVGYLMLLHGWIVVLLLASLPAEPHRFEPHGSVHASSGHSNHTLRNRNDRF